MSTPATRKGGSPKRPWTVVNMAMTADGKIATAGREVTSFGSPLDLEALYHLRSRVDAVLCGARTVEETGATLANREGTTRSVEGAARRASLRVRVIVSGSASFSLTAALWEDRSTPIAVLVSGEAPASRRNALRQMADSVWESPGPGVDLVRGVEWIHSTWDIRRMVCEGGGTLNAALFRAGLVDELRLTLCPRLFGGKSSPSIADGLAGALGDANRFEKPRVRRVGDELFLVFRKKPVTGPVPGTTSPLVGSILAEVEPACPTADAGPASGYPRPSR